MLRLQRIEHQVVHLDVAHTAVGLELVLFVEHDGLAHQDQPTLEVDVLPFEAVGLTRSHAREEAHGEVVAVVRAYGGEDRCTSSRVNGITSLRFIFSGLMLRNAEVNSRRSAASLRIWRNGFITELMRRLDNVVWDFRVVTLASVPEMPVRLPW